MVEQGTLVIMRAGAHQQWWGAGHHLLIVVVVGTHGWHWVVVTISGAGGCLSSFVGGHGIMVVIHGYSWWVAEGSGGSFVGGGVGAPCCL